MNEIQENHFSSYVVNSLRHLFLILLLSFSLCSTLSARCFFTSDIEPRRIHVVLEGDVGGDFYRSPYSPLYRNDQWFVAGTLVLGYNFSANVFAGVGGGIRHCNNDQKTSFPVAASFLAFATSRHVFLQVKWNPYADLRCGAVVYPKWNSFIKPYAAIGAGIHPFPRLSIGGRFSWCGTLDDRHTIELSLCLAFCI